MHGMKTMEQFEAFSNSKLPGLNDLPPEFWSEEIIKYSVYRWEYILSF